ncbi:hypothetical protein COCON_G00057270 [Conger conger]|uniref:Uncharacterized protein n=1 Tax=Conger conger TaxID=82655 RepID=A0A9Q1I337_CONCO|nr:hypothetical protein COCON_G00057270 [Conger conger]
MGRTKSFHLSEEQVSVARSRNPGSRDPLRRPGAEADSVLQLPPAWLPSASSPPEASKRSVTTLSQGSPLWGQGMSPLLWTTGNLRCLSGGCCEGLCFARGARDSEGEPREERQRGHLYASVRGRAREVGS